jgi:hypothetical protein
VQKIPSFLQRIPLSQHNGERRKAAAQVTFRKGVAGGGLPQGCILKLLPSPPL